MKRTVSLFEFMPYGAPELLAAARPHLFRALLLGSCVPVAGFVAALALLPALRTVAVVPAIHPPVHHLAPPPLLPEPRPPASLRPVVPARPAAPDHAAVAPVEEMREVPPASAAAGSATDPAGTLSTGPLPGTIPTPPSPAAELEPVIGGPPPDELPQRVTSWAPPYPELAREAGVEGLVLVHALIGTDGRVIRAEVDPRHSIRLLDEAAKTAALRWVFTPAITSGRPVRVWYAIPFKFVLHD